MEEREISLVDLGVEILLRWRWILIIMIVGGVVVSGLKYAKLELQKSDEKETLEEQLSDVQIADVNLVLDYEQTFDEQMHYLRESELMKINPLQVIESDVVLSIQSSDLEQAYNIKKVYEDILTCTDFYNYIEEHCGIEKNINELISLEEPLEENLQYGNGVKVVVLSDNETTSRAISEAIVMYIQEKCIHLKDILGNHEVKVVLQSTGMTTNENIFEKQREYFKYIMKSKMLSVELKDTFSNEQMNYYNVLVEKKDSIEPGIVSAVHGENNIAMSATGVKYFMVGMLGTAFIYIFFICISYIMSDKLRLTDDLWKLYEIPQFGVIVKNPDEKRFLGFIDRMIQKLRFCNKRRFSFEESIRLAETAIKVSVSGKECSNICLLGCNLCGETMNVCEHIERYLKQNGYKVQILNNILYDAEKMETLIDSDEAILIETAKSTLHEEVNRELELLKRWNITILGGIVVYGGR